MVDKVWRRSIMVLLVTLGGLIVGSGLESIELMGTLQHMPRTQGHDIEWVYQAPRDIKGIIFLAHGCHHNSRDFWPSGDNCPSCLGLPEEGAIVAAGLSNNYFVLAITSFGTCWSNSVDAGRVEAVISTVRQAHNMMYVPLYAIGVSSGGAFVSRLPLVMPVTAVAVQIMSTPASVLLRGSKVYPPSLWICMEKDERTLISVQRSVHILSERGKHAVLLTVPAQPITPHFFATRIPTLGGFKYLRSEITGRVAQDQRQMEGEETEGGKSAGTRPDSALALSSMIFEKLKENHLLDENGYLKDDPRHSSWREALQNLKPFLDGDNLEADRSSISEEMNVAFASHEITSDFMNETLKFFERASPLSEREL